MIVNASTAEFAELLERVQSEKLEAVSILIARLLGQAPEAAQ